MGGYVSYGRGGRTRRGYLAVPDPGEGPGLIVLQEWWGLVDHITDVVDWLAGAGYVALAPDLYLGALTSDLYEARKLSLGLAMDQAAIEIADAVGYLAKRCTDADRLGALGFGMGGSLALWSAAFLDEVVVAVAFYPPRASMAPRWIKYAGGKIAMIHAAEGDGGSAAPGITEAVASITAAGGQVEVYDYPGTHHAFCNDEQPEVYHPAAATLARTRTLDLFDRKLRKR